MTLGSILSQVGSVFVELDKTEESAAPAKAAITSKATSRPATTFTSNVDPEMEISLNKVITDRRTAYTSLLESSEELKSIIPDDIQRLKAAAKTTKASKSSINNAIDVHLSDLEGAKMRFSKASEQQLAQKSGGLRTNAQGLQNDNANRATSVEEKQRQIVELQGLISQDEAKITELNSQADLAEADIRATALRFERTVESVKQSLSNQKSQLSAILS